MFKKQFTYISIFAGLLFIVACNKSFVNVQAPSQIAADGYYTSEASFKSLLTGVYGSLRQRYDSYWIMAELPSDNTLAPGSVQAGQGPIDQFSWTSQDANVLKEWQGDYQTIAYCNNFIEQLTPFSSMDSTRKTDWIGEAKFIRALMYFRLVQYFGDVPLVLKKINTQSEAFSYLRDSSEKVYAQIIQDLSDAELVLPVNYTASTDFGRVTSGAAKALLGKVYLTMHNWDAASDKLAELINLNTYSLLPNFADVFSIVNENNAEIIFSIQYSRGTNKEGSNFTQTFLPTRLPALITLTPKGANQGTKNLFTAFESGDLRKTTCIQQYGSYYTRKYWDDPPLVNEGECNWIVLRYADVLLMYAEALMEQGTTLSIVQSTAIVNNQIRKRAGLAGLGLNLTQANLRLAIEKERRVELCFEGHRWFDLVRTGRMVAVMTAQFAADKLNYTVIPERALFPIPFREITLNPRIKQNAGY